MNKREYCESRESVAYYSGLGGLEIKGIDYGVIDFVYCVSGCWGGNWCNGKIQSVFTVAKSTTPQTGKTARFSGYTGTKSRSMNVLEWGVEL